MDDLAAKPSRAASLREMTRALNNRNFRLFFLGQGGSLIGTWMQQVALSWLVYDLTHSEWWLGVVSFSGQILIFATAPFAGVVADRVDRRRLLIFTQTLAMVHAFVLAALTLSDTIQVWQIVALAAFLGLVGGFDIPARQSFLVEMLEQREHLSNAIALNSFMFNGARFVGPAIAGVVIASVGEGVCFLVNGFSFLAVIGAYVAMNVKPRAGPALHPRALDSFKEGLRYTWHFVPLRTLLLLLAALSLVAMPYVVIMPAFVREVLHGDAHTFGFCMSAVGTGALIGAVVLASRRSVRGLGRTIAIAAATFGCALAAFSLSKSLWLSLTLLVLCGVGAMIQTAACNTLIQTLVDDDKRGRVMSFYTMCFMGMGPFGSLLIGALADYFDAPAALLVGGAAALVAASLFALELPRLGRMVHPIYVRLGILPASEDVPQSAMRM